MDLNGRFVASGTLKEADADRMVEEIVKIGIPSLVASDVNPAPSFVLKIAARFNVRTFAPGRTMLQAEKSSMAADTQNLHERDALAAAVKAYREYANRLRQIEAIETNLDKDRLKHLVIQGFSLRNAMLMLEKKGGGQMEGAKAGNGKAEKEKKDWEIVALAEENVNLRKALEAERKMNEALLYEIGKIKGAKYAEMGRDAEVRKLKAQVERMDWVIRKLKGRKN